MDRILVPYNSDGLCFFKNPVFFASFLGHRKKEGIGFYAKFTLDSPSLLNSFFHPSLTVHFELFQSSRKTQSVIKLSHWS